MSGEDQNFIDDIFTTTPPQTFSSFLRGVYQAEEISCFPRCYGGACRSSQWTRVKKHMPICSPCKRAVCSWCFFPHSNLAEYIPGVKMLPVLFETQSKSRCSSQRSTKHVLSQSPEQEFRSLICSWSNISKTSLQGVRIFLGKVCGRRIKVVGALFSTSLSISITSIF